MAKRILAPIDAREHSERVIPVVAAMAREMGSTVRLLRVFPVPERVMDDNGRTIAYVDQEMERLTARGLDDLHPAEAALEGVPVETVVRFGETANEILLEAEAFGADLIVLGSPRRGEVATRLFGGVTLRVLRRSSCPVIVAPRHGPRRQPAVSGQVRGQGQI